MLNEQLEQEAWIEEYAQVLGDARPATVRETQRSPMQQRVLELPDLPVGQADLLTRLAQLLSCNDYADLLHTGLLQALELLPCFGIGGIWIYEQRVGKLTLMAHNMTLFGDAVVQAVQGFQLYPGEGFAGHAFQYDQITLNIHTRGSPLGEMRSELRFMSEHIRAFMPEVLVSLCIPLKTAGVPVRVGVLELLSTNLFDSPPHELCLELAPALHAMLNSYATFLATAISNKQRYDTSERHCRRLDGFDAVVTAISTATDLPDLLRSVLDVVIGLQPVSGGAILLLDPAQARLTLGLAHNLPDEYCDTVRSLPVSGSAFEEVVRYGQPALRPLIEEQCEAQLMAVGFESGTYLPLLAGGTVVGVLALFGDSDLYNQIEMSYLMPLMNQIGFAIANVRLYEESQIERQRLNTVINSIAEGVVVLDNQGRLVLANESAMELLSLDALPYQQPISEMTDFYAIRDLSGAPLPVEQLPMARALSGEVFYDYRVLLRGVSGQNSVMSFSGAPARAGPQHPTEGAVVVFRDVTAYQRLERAKDEFLAVAAHELRSPLTAVRGFTDQLLRRERERATAEERDLRGLTLLSEEVGHMLRMVDNLLDVSRLDAGQLDLQVQSVDVVQLAQRVLDQQRMTATSQDLVLFTDSDELYVLCDALRIRQVLINLVGNALKYSPSGSQVEVRISVRSLSRPDEPAGLPQRSQREVLFAVSDMGAGIEPELQARLFERFYRVKYRREEGLGLGLYLSREFVLLHGGQIWVESAVGKGSTFYFTLPLSTPDDA